MRLHVARLPSLLAERRSSALLGVLIIALVWSGVAYQHFREIQNEREKAERTTQSLALVFEESVLRSIGEIDKSLLYLRRTIELRKSSVDFGTIVNTTDVLSDIIVQVAIIDAKGMMQASNAGPQPAPTLDLSDREHYRVHVESSEDRLFISKPVLGRVSGRWSVQFTRRFSNTDGSFAGVVVASLDPEQLTKVYDRIDFGPSASIALIGADGLVRSSGGNDGDFKLGSDLTRTPLFAQIRAGANATFEVAGDSQAGDQLVSIRNVREHPLWVSVSVNETDLRQRVGRALRGGIIAGVVLTLVILATLERILRTEARARQKADHLQCTLENISQGIMLVTADQHIPVINSRCGELLGLPREVVDHPPLFDVLTQRHGHIISPSWGSPQPAVSAEPRGGLHQETFERRMPSGLVIEVLRRHLTNGGFVYTFSDVTERVESETRVTKLAFEDPLTRLPNRRQFRAVLDQMFDRGVSLTKREGGFALLFLDLDRFKVINDTLGHRTGDLLLHAVGERLREALGPKPLLARLGGDEFAILVESSDVSELDKLAARLVAAVGHPFRIADHQVCSGVSIGIALAGRDGAHADDLLVAADLALYAVKARGRGSHEFFKAAMTRELTERRQIEMDLREVIERGGLELNYQPIVSLGRGTLTGFETLVRWPHPTKGLISPAVFIPVAEDSRLIIPLGEWVLREACREAVGWPNDLRVAVNLSPVQFLDPDFPSLVERIVAETGLEPQRLELEITEGVLMENSATTLAILRRLKQQGIRIALDDFGTGYSSLSYLRSFPFDKIKVDRTFVAGLASGVEHVTIIQAVVSIARALGMTTTAEGIETGSQNQFLTALGCDEGQGYLFGRPVPATELDQHLGSWSSTVAA